MEPIYALERREPFDDERELLLRYLDAIADPTDREVLEMRWSTPRTPPTWATIGARFGFHTSRAMQRHHRALIELRRAAIRDGALRWVSRDDALAAVQAIDALRGLPALREALDGDDFGAVALLDELRGVRALRRALDRVPWKPGTPA